MVWVSKIVNKYFIKKYKEYNIAPKFYFPLYTQLVSVFLKPSSGLSVIANAINRELEKY